ncbi:MAG TPA: hypothetical protein VH683_07180 [Thermoleophilaceae bacterium]|jgi:hypothetical protein
MANLPHIRLYRVGTAAALIVAPLLFLLDNLIHPEELTRGNELEQVNLIADAYTRWQAAHAIGFLAILAFAPAVLGLAFLVRRKQPGYGLLAGALALAGVLGLAAVVTIDGYAWAVAGNVSAEPAVGAAAAAATLKELQESSWSFVYYLTPLGFIVGMLMLASGIARQGAVPVWAGALLALAVLMVGTETAIVSNEYFIAGAGVFMAAGIAVALPLLRMTDAQFAQGSV